MTSIAISHINAIFTRYRYQKRLTMVGNGMKCVVYIRKDFFRRVPYVHEIASMDTRGI